jgi:tetratricopeptide (TPR) repeat protein
MDACLSEQRVIDFVQGRLPPSEVHEVEAHIDGCAACRELVAQAAEALIEVSKRERTGAPAETGAPLATGVRVGRYIVLELVGRGAMGTVYAVYDPELNRRVALKLLRSDLPRAVPLAELRNRLLREAQAMARLSHPNVMPVHDVGTHGHGIFIAMDFVGGVTLRGWLAGQSRRWEEVLPIFLQAGQGLAAAHRAGLIHRDFKPENVLLDKSGRVCVTDFGLARSASDSTNEGAALPPVSIDKSPLAVTLTKTGATVGTPAYMAPEQVLGEHATAHADQFSFCVALYEALYGERPFPGRTVSELRAAALAGDIREPPKGARVPTWLRRIVVRGLKGSPAERFPSMDALLVALKSDPRARRRRAALGIAAAGILVATLFASRYWGEQRRLCTGASAELASAWSEQSRREVEEAFAKTKVPYAADAASGVSRILSAYASEWERTHTEACEATREHGVQSEALLDLRMECLRGRLQEMGALVETFARADARVVARSVGAASRLKSLAPCANAKLLTARVPPPQDPEARTRVEAIRTLVAQANARHEAGQLAAGLDIAKRAAAEARALGYRPLEAEALYVLGRLQDDTGAAAAAEESLHAAAVAAESSHHDEVDAQAMTRLASLVGRLQNRPREALRFADHAEAAIERLGGDPALREGLLHARGRILLGEPTKALRYDQEALESAERRLGGEHLTVATMLNAVGIDLAEEGKSREALPYFQRTLSIRERALGPKHPLVAEAVGNLAILLRRVGKPDEAVALHRKAIALFEVLRGPESPAVAVHLGNLGNTLIDLERSGEALAAYRRALAIREKTFAKDAPQLAFPLEGVAKAFMHLGRSGEAQPYCRRALEIREKHFGLDDRRTALTVGLLGELLMRMGRPEEGLPNLARAAATFEKKEGPESRSLMETLGVWGEALLKLGKPLEARAHLERALGICEKTSGAQALCAGEISAKLGEVWLALGSPAKARAGLERAIAVFKAVGSVPARLARAQALLQDLQRSSRR